MARETNSNKVPLNQNGISFVDPEGYPLASRAEEIFRSHSFNKTEEDEVSKQEQICSVKARSETQPNYYTSNNISKIYLSRGRKFLLVPAVKFNKKALRSSKCRPSVGDADCPFNLNHRNFMTDESVSDYNCRLKFCNVIEDPNRSPPSFRVPSNFTNNRNHICERQLENKGVDNNSSKSKTKASKGKRCVVINTWEEFYYGISVLDSKRTNLPGITSFSEKLHRIFDRFLSRAFVEFLVAFVYFSIFFLTCLIYNMFWQFIGYILLTGHLQIHEQACLRKIDIRFTGSVFQGPAYVYMRQVWCAHCAHKSSEKITLKLMKDFREDYEKRKKNII